MVNTPPLAARAESLFVGETLNQVKTLLGEPVDSMRLADGITVVAWRQNAMSGYVVVAFDGIAVVAWAHVPG